ncbi:3-oxosteroid 1-dehydrogenase [Frankia canadensis]|uniref:3-oxosteroid 1-dehydrogenase n=1 Tax=Frankia canadensis TaxID=1836972 RepID=A0A2I2L2U7_9ACTN|nr:FAD-binding protein [Frankia canadensis]SNQ52225.1 3-oxosteroid 1-dehydrogenase [Frankia canadensis]SOU59515.1 3-oxosteroid 1-dehydrogenase [Frankia canadensis]
MSDADWDDAGWDVVTDLLLVGSGGGALCAALAARAAGDQVLVLEKTDQIGGSTAMSGGVLWLPNNPVSRAAGVSDSREDALRYFASVVGDAGPSTSPARVDAFLDAIEPMVTFLSGYDLRFRHCEGYSDYYDDRPGGKARGRSLETDLFDCTELGPWRDKLRISEGMPPVPMYTGEVATGTMPTTAAGARTAARVAGRFARATLTRRQVRGSGAALQGRMLRALLRAEVPVWTSTPAVDLIVEGGEGGAGGEVVGVVAERDGRRIRVRARAGVLLDVGGFSHNARMRDQYGRAPASTAWTSANPGDTGEMITAAMRHGAAVDLMDEAWWIPSSVLPDGKPQFAVYERSKPFAILVDESGARFTNEAASYMEVGQAMYERNATVPAVPSWWIMDSRNRRSYVWGTTPGGINPKEWLRSGYLKKADTIGELARQCGIDPAGLEATVERFNRHAAEGRDPEFHKGERAYDRYYGDPRVQPNPCVGPVERAPFYAVALYPGDVGTCGGLLTDEHARVLSTDGAPIAGLYAAGNCTASVVGRTYPGAGASIGASFVFGWLGAHHAHARARRRGDADTAVGGAAVPNGVGPTDLPAASGVASARKGDHG